MVDFIKIAHKSPKKGLAVVYPVFVVRNVRDIMVRGKDFYAVWVEDRNQWSTSEDDVIDIVDAAMESYRREHNDDLSKFEQIVIAHMWDSTSGSIDDWHKYCQKQMRDNYHQLDEKLMFDDDKPVREDYSSKKLPYSLSDAPHESYDLLMSTLYDPTERHKIEWAIGSVVNGDSKRIQKFLVMYGQAGTGKSTVLNIIEKLFEGYYTIFDAKSIGSASGAFALESFRSNPLVGIQHDGDLSKIEDNTRLNSLVSHEKMLINEKYKSQYEARINTFLFMGTNRPVKITDAKSGLLRRLIDVQPSGRKLPRDVYEDAVERVIFELGSIAKYCKEVYEEDPAYYDNYRPDGMLRASNDFYNFMVDNLRDFKAFGKVEADVAWRRYIRYTDEAKVPYPLNKRTFIEEMRSYFDHYEGLGLNGYFEGLKLEKFGQGTDIVEVEPVKSWLEFNSNQSLLSEYCRDDYAQYANPDGTPRKKWDNVKTTLKDLDETRLHYLLIRDKQHIVIDFDLKNDKGEKDYELNLQAASKFPPTYAELSKSECGIHLHYIYEGDPEELSPLYDDDIEIKVFTGKMSLRRKLTKCNDIAISKISSGLPRRERKNNMISDEFVLNEKIIRTMIKRNLNKEYHDYTKPSMDYIKKILDDAYDSGISYNVEDMRSAVFAFGASSTHQSATCTAMIKDMKWKSEDVESDILEEINTDTPPIVFFDVEVFPNLLLICYKLEGEQSPVLRMVNPSAEEVGKLIRFRLVGFNNRAYDNHILYARLMGYTNEQIYDLSKRLVNSEKGSRPGFGEAYNLSYTDIYDFASAGNKKSLKKLEIEMGIHHEELGLPWDEPVDESLWEKVGQYCDNDVIATEAAFKYLSADWTARQILADLADKSVNTSTNNLTAAIIFDGNRNPQSEFRWRDMSKPVLELPEDVIEFLEEACPEMMAEKHGEIGSLLPYFDGYTFENGKSTYKGIEVGEGGFVYAEPGMYTNVALLDISSMHPHSAIAEVVFGPRYTSRFRDVVVGRVDIKHEDWDDVENILDGKLVKHIQRVKSGELKSKDLANGLKTAINSVYGQTYARHENPFRDPKNIDNIIAKRGALFMIDLKEEVEARGFKVAHIKTDSIKIPNATPEIIQFVMDFGKRYGYSFEHEATYERMCLTNNAAYIARYDNGEWTATGKPYIIPYIFKKLFSHEEITFNDMCETFEAKKGSLYLDDNESKPDVSDLEKELDKVNKKISKLGEEAPKSLYEQREELIEKIKLGHRYIFVGKVGHFTPIKPGAGGALLMRESAPGKYAAAQGTTGYRWMEAEKVAAANYYDYIDDSFYENQVADVIATIRQFGDYEWFVNPDDDTPPWEVSDEPWNTNDSSDIFNKR